MYSVSEMHEVNMGKGTMWDECDEGKASRRETREEDKSKKTDYTIHIEFDVMKAYIATHI